MIDKSINKSMIETLPSSSKSLCENTLLLYKAKKAIIGNRYHTQKHTFFYNFEA